jgi:hypothetical protein
MQKFGLKTAFYILNKLFADPLRRIGHIRRIDIRRGYGGFAGGAWVPGVWVHQAR